MLDNHLKSVNYFVVFLIKLTRTLLLVEWKFLSLCSSILDVPRKCLVEHMDRLAN